jgi:hypothetical protein
MEKDWVKVYTTTDAVKAELVKDLLDNNDIPAVVLNKKEKLTALLFVLAGAIVAVFTVVVLRQLRSRVSDPARIVYARFCDKLRRRGLPRGPAEGPVDYAHRVGRLRPELQPAVAAITRLYVALRYGPGVDMGALDDLRRRVAQFKA